MGVTHVPILGDNRIMWSQKLHLNTGPPMERGSTYGGWHRGWSPVSLLRYGEGLGGGWGDCVSCEKTSLTRIIKNNTRDFPGGPVFGNLPCNAGDMGSVPGQETRIPHVCVCVRESLCQVQLFATPWTVACSSALPGSSVHGILQARVPEWFAISFSRGSFWPRDWTQVSCIASEPPGTLACLGTSKPWGHDERSLHDPMKH